MISHFIFILRLLLKHHLPLGLLVAHHLALVTLGLVEILLQVLCLHICLLKHLLLLRIPTYLLNDNWRSFPWLSCSRSVLLLLCCHFLGSLHCYLLILLCYLRHLHTTELLGRLLGFFWLIVIVVAEFVLTLWRLAHCDLVIIIVIILFLLILNWWGLAIGISWSLLLRLRPHLLIYVLLLLNHFNVICTLHQILHIWHCYLSKDLLLIFIFFATQSFVSRLIRVG